VLTGVQPEPNGRFDSESAELSEQLWSRLGVLGPNAEHPFVAEGVYPDFDLLEEQSDEGREVLEGAARGSDLFSIYNIRPGQGRRVLLFGYLSPLRDGSNQGIPL
jgi:hypothetical protein